MQQPTPLAKHTLDDVESHFDHWRLSRIKQGKIPQSLWDHVKTLIGRYPVNKIAQTLRVSFYQISPSINN